MIHLYQEQIPFTNKVLTKEISKDGSFTNPVIMPFALDFTSYNNNLETVFYIRNDSQQHYYNNVVISLMKINGSDTSAASGHVDFSEFSRTFNLNGINDVPAELAYTGATSGTVQVPGYQANYSVVTSDNDISVKFSYGYDELSVGLWAGRRPVLIIPSIGNSSMPNTQYIPIRMRLSWKQPPTLITIRDYFIDISYQSEGTVAS